MQAYLLLFNVVNITNDPMDTTVCNGGFANISCGFSGANIMPTDVLPEWRVITRHFDGSVNGNSTYDSANLLVNDLEWIPDVNNSDNSYLRVGRVNMTHNQSSYQCIIHYAGEPDRISSTGTVTVIG